MKSVKSGLLVLALTASSIALAEKAKDSPACANVVKACEGAGYMPGEHKVNGKGLWVDCVGALAKGKTVANVSVSQAEAKACQETEKTMMKEHRAQHAMRRGGPMGAGGNMGAGAPAAGGNPAPSTQPEKK